VDIRLLTYSFLTVNFFSPFSRDRHSGVYLLSFIKVMCDRIILLPDDV